MVVIFAVASEVLVAGSACSTAGEMTFVSSELGWVNSSARADWRVIRRAATAAAFREGFGESFVVTLGEGFGAALGAAFVTARGDGFFLGLGVDFLVLSRGETEASRCRK